VVGAGQYATIFGMTMLLPFAAVPVSAGLTVIQIIASSLRESRVAIALDDYDMSSTPVRSDS
jgi:hypothetical protein